MLYLFIENTHLISIRHINETKPLINNTPNNNN